MVPTFPIPCEMLAPIHATPNATVVLMPSQASVNGCSMMRLISGAINAIVCASTPGIDMTPATTPLRNRSLNPSVIMS